MARSQIVQTSYQSTFFKYKFRSYLRKICVARLSDKDLLTQFIYKYQGYY